MNRLKIVILLTLALLIGIGLKPAHAASDHLWNLVGNRDAVFEYMLPVIVRIQTRFPAAITDPKFARWGGPLPLNGLFGSGFLFKLDGDKVYALTHSSLLSNLDPDLEYPIRAEIVTGRYQAGFVGGGAGKSERKVKAELDDPNYRTLTEPETKSYPAKLIGIDPNYSVGVIQIMMPAKYFPKDRIHLGTEKDLRIGRPVSHVGASLNGIDFTITTGIINAVRANVPGSLETQSDLYLLHDCAFDLGALGGPIVTIDGTIVGLSRTPMEMYGVSNYINAAAPIPDVVKAANRILGGEIKVACLGAETILLNDQIRKRLKIGNDIQYGRFVNAVQPGSPGAEGQLTDEDREFNAKLIEQRDRELANIIDTNEKVEVEKDYEMQMISRGFKPGDIILMADGEVIKTDYEWKLFIRNLPVGKLMLFTVLRDGQKLFLTIKVGENDEETGICKHFKDSSLAKTIASTTNDSKTSPKTKQSSKLSVKNTN